MENSAEAKKNLLGLSKTRKYFALKRSPRSYTKTKFDYRGYNMDIYVHVFTEPIKSKNWKKPKNGQKMAKIS